MRSVDMTHEQVTIGELCEAIMSGRVKAVVRDGHYEVKAVEIRGMQRSSAELFATLERLRPRLAGDLALDAGCLDEIRPCGEDIA